MPRLSVRRFPSLSDTLARSLAGMGLGFLGGFLVRGLLGQVGGDRVRHLVSRFTTPRPAALSARKAAQRVAAAIQADPELAALGLEALPVRGGRVELHGWVPSRQAGARARRLAREAAPEVELTSRLLVRGEDDEPPSGPPERERLPA